jgi:hypothetical protein
MFPHRENLIHVQVLSRVSQKLFDSNNISIEVGNGEDFGKEVKELFPESFRASEANVKKIKVAEKRFDFLVHFLNEMKNLFVESRVLDLEGKFSALANELNDIGAVET